MKTIGVPRAALDAGAFRRRHEIPRRPIVLAGVAADWPAMRWTAADIVARHGDVEIDVRTTPPGAPEVWRGDPHDSFGRERMTLARCVEDATKPAPEVRAYLQYCDLAAVLPGLAPDVRDPPHLPRLLRSPPLLWISGAGVKSPLHFDFTSALVTQVVGRKRWLLVPPEDSRFVAPARDRILWRTTPLDLAAPDAERWPALDRARIHECVVGPGDALFVPYRWWHFAEADGFAVSVSWWWEPSIATRLWDRAVDGAKAPLRAIAKRMTS